MEIQLTTVQNGSKVMHLRRDKMERFAEMCRCATAIAKADRSIRRAVSAPTSESINCGVRLTLPSPYVFDDLKVKSRFANLYIMADTVVVSAAARGDRQIISFDLNNIWDENKEEPMELKTNVVKKTWRVDAFMEAKSSIAYQYTVQAESEANARAAAEAQLPSGFVIRCVEEESDGSETAVDLDGMERI